VNFLNFEDPAVLARLTGPDYEQLWKKTYGYDYVIKKGLARKKQKGQQNKQYAEINFNKNTSQNLF
jgi:hypothetical protein